MYWHRFKSLDESKKLDPFNYPKESNFDGFDETKCIILGENVQLTKEKA